jgi:hypothetical protein
MNKIQATFTGKAGKPCTLFSAYDPETRILVISREADYRPDRHEDCAVITNIPDIQRDALFTDADFGAAIAAFQSLKNGIAANEEKSARLVFGERAARANPENYIQQDGMDSSGHVRYRIADEITAAQMAALATCLYATKINAIENTFAMADNLVRVMAGEIITI